jgi:cob(I)alamin adenosyltransferase
MSKTMVAVSTKTGDAGETGLANGQRLSKAEPLFEVLGTLDELSSWLGLCRALLPAADQAQQTWLHTTQEQLFHLGAELAGSTKTQLADRSLADLETHQQTWQNQLSASWTTQFLYPGGVVAAAHLDVARTVARRLERLVVVYHQHQPVRPLVLQYLNRLSDTLYVLRCWYNDRQGHPEEKFQVGAKSTKK